MQYTVGKFDLMGSRRRSFWKELSKTLALTLVLFALTFRTALPLGVAVVADENGIPMVICQQIAQVTEQLGSEDDASSPSSTPAYQCPFCTVLNADNAPLLLSSAPDLEPEFPEFLPVQFHEFDGAHRVKRQIKYNLGRDPPQA